MAQYQPDDYDYAADDYEMADYDEDLEDEYPDRGRGDADSESDDDYEAITRPTDTSAAEARRGKDIQGIPWDRLNFTREKYRETRLEQYKNYENLPQLHDELDKVCKKTQKGGNFYEFCYNTRSVKSTIVHFQLRNLVWATSKHDVYLLSKFSVIHWSTVSCKETEFLNVEGSIVPSEVHPGTLVHGLTRVQISTMAVKDNLLVAGGFQGELICKFLDRPDVSYCSKITYDDNAITNAVEIYHSSSGANCFMTSSNDSGVRVFDTERFAMIRHFSFPWPVNHTSISPDKKLLVVVGDNAEGLLSDCQTGKTVATLEGHSDYSFASAWHPDGRVFATGNQDSTCRLWDVRNTKTSLEVLKGHLGAIRSIRFSLDGQFMAMAEPADFVHIYDTKHNYNKSQEIDFFGEISGMSFSPDTESLFIGVADRTYGSLLGYSRLHEYFYLDSLI
jgi:WD40 repeat protein